MNFMWFSSLFKINWLTSKLFKKKKKILSGKSKGPKILKKGCDSSSPLLGPSPPSLLYWFNSKWIWVPLPLSTMPALQGQCCSHPWHFRVPAPGYAMTPSLFSVYGPIPSPDSGFLECIPWVMVIDCSQWSSLPPLPQPHLPSGFPFPLNGTHCLPTVFHFLFLLPPLLPLCAFDGTPYPFCILPSPCSQPGSCSLSHVTTSWFEFHFADFFQMCLSPLQIYPSRAGVWMCHPPGFICRKWGNPWTGMRLCRKMTYARVNFPGLYAC